MRIWKFLVFNIIISALYAQEVIDLYNGEVPYENGDKAELTIFLPSDKSSGRALIICPGGGYDHLAFENEGTAWASYFNEQGIAAFVLKYRMPKGNPLVPISDAEEAIKIVRKNAEKYKIDPEDVGIMGSSAGGHLASTIATHSDGDAKPNFHILFYPVITMDPTFTHLGSMKNFLGSDSNNELIEKYSNDLQVTNKTPKVFITLSDDDGGVPPKNGLNYYMQCNLKGVSASLHVYPTGGHGWGFRTTFPYHSEVLKELKSWLQSF